MQPGEAMRAFSLTVQGKLGTSLRAPLWDPWRHMELPRMGRAVATKGSVLLSVWGTRSGTEESRESRNRTPLMTCSGDLVL